MSSRHLASRDDDERGRSVDRLRAAVAERREAQTRATKGTTKGTTKGSPAGSIQDDAEASASLSPGEGQVSARERRLDSVKKQDS
jgi:hypothetical protein